MIRSIRTVGGHRRYSPRILGQVAAITTVSDQDPAPSGTVLALELDDLLAAENPDGLGETLRRTHRRLGSWARVADRLGILLTELGSRYRTGALTLIDERLFSERLYRSLCAIGDELSAAVARDAPCCALATVEGENHVLGLALAELTAKEQGWKTIWIGRDTPTPNLVTFVETADVQMLALSASVRSIDAEALLWVYFRITDAARIRGIDVVLGGEGAWPSEIDYGHRIHLFSEFALVLSANQ